MEVEKEALEKESPGPASNSGLSLLSLRFDAKAQAELDKLVREGKELERVLQVASCDTAAALEQPLETLRELKKQLETERSKAAQAHEALGEDRVRDHDHLAGKYRGAAHNKCNLEEGKKTRKTFYHSRALS
jgi:FtsZ-binding cell division protein ZapB